MPTSPSPAGRAERTTAAILTAAREILAEGGVRALTVERVAERSGVAKTSIYRRYDSKLEIALAVLIAMIPGVATTPDLGDTRRELIHFVRRTIRVLRADPMDRVMKGMVSDLASDIELAAAFRVQVVAVRMAETERLLRRGIERGQIRPDVQPELVHELLIGPVYFRLLLSGEPLRTTFAEKIVDALMPGLVPTADPAPIREARRSRVRAPQSPPPAASSPPSPRPRAAADGAGSRALPGATGRRRA